MAAELSMGEDGSVLRRAHRQRLVAAVFEVVCAVAVIGCLVASLASAAWLLAAGMAGLYFADARAARRQLTWSAAARPSDGKLLVGPTSLVIEHPCLERALELPLADVQAFDVEMDLPKRGRYALFPVRRLDGVLHPLDEPDHFLSRGGPDLGERHVGMPFLDVSGRLPNVALVFRAPRELRAATHPASGIDPVPTSLGGRSFSAATLHLVRMMVTVDAPGIFLHVLEPDRLASDLEHAGIARGFTCLEWVMTTGQPHRDVAPDVGPDR